MKGPRFLPRARSRICSRAVHISHRKICQSFAPRRSCFLLQHLRGSQTHLAFAVERVVLRQYRTPGPPLGHALADEFADTLLFLWAGIAPVPQFTEDGGLAGLEGV